jgi:dCTP deaminase
MNLPDYLISEHCRAGMVAPFDESLVNPASLDVRLGDELLIESAESRAMVRYPFHMHSEEDPYWMRSGQFVLAATLEVISIPITLTAQFVLKSSRGREGIEHLMAGFVDPGWHGQLTLELHNSRQLHAVAIWPGMRIGQLVFSRLQELPLRNYSATGRYHGDMGVKESRG